MQKLCPKQRVFESQRRIYDKGFPAREYRYLMTGLPLQDYRCGTAEGSHLTSNSVQRRTRVSDSANNRERECTPLTGNRNGDSIRQNEPLGESKYVSFCGANMR